MASEVQLGDGWLVCSVLLLVSSKLRMSMGRIVAAVAVVAVIAAAAFCGASGHAAGNGVSSSGPGAVKLCGCQCISAAGAGSAAGVGTDVVLVAVKPHISGPGKAGGIAGG